MSKQSRRQAKKYLARRRRSARPPRPARAPRAGAQSEPPPGRHGSYYVSTGIVAGVGSDFDGFDDGCPVCVALRECGSTEVEPGLFQVDPEHQARVDEAFLRIQREQLLDLYSESLAATLRDLEVQQAQRRGA